MNRILLILLFFPSVTFNLLSAEIFPWGILFYLFVTYKYFCIDIEAIIFIFILTFFTFISLSINDTLNYFEVFRSSFAYLNAIFSFFALKIFLSRDDNFVFFKKTVKFLCFFYMVIGGLQIVGFNFIIEPLLSFFKGRGGAGGDAGRGASILATEPSRAAFEFIFLYAIYKILYHDESSNGLWFDIASFIFLLLVVRSAMGVILFSILISLIYANRLSLLKILFIFISSIILFFIFNILIPVEFNGAINANSRAIDILAGVYNSNSVNEAFNYLVSSSGFRAVSIMSSYYYGLTSFIGSGIGNWHESSLDALRSFGVHEMSILYFSYTCGDTLCSVRPTSILAAVSLDTGIVGVGFLLLFFFKNASASYDSDTKPYFIFLIICFLVSSSTGHPSPWLLFALLCSRDSFLGKKHEKN